MRQLSVVSIARMSEEQAKTVFMKLRWPDTEGEPICPKCNSTGTYFLKTTKKFRCIHAKCQHQFSVTSGTVFASSKMPCKDLLLGIALFSGGAKGVSSLQLSRYLDRNYKPVFVLAHKLREIIQRADLKLDGIVEIDGCTIGGHRIASNMLLPRQERGRNGERKRLYSVNFNQRRVVVGIREKHNATMTGPGRTRCFVVRKESEACGEAQKWISAGAVIHADMAHAWNGMKKLYRMLQVNHSGEAYVSNDGIHTNNIESFWSLLRKMHHGTHHHFRAENLSLYANELAWRQDHRKLTEHERIVEIARLAMAAKPSERWVGYANSGGRRRRSKHEEPIHTDFTVRPPVLVELDLGTAIPTRKKPSNLKVVA